MESQRRCKNSAMTIRIDGTPVTPLNSNVLGNVRNWLLFEGVYGVSIVGGVIDGQGLPFGLARLLARVAPL
ncbi:unnamed protein product [Camellia sinensis]